MMLTLMALVLALGVTGYMQDLDAFFGDAWLMNTHEWLAHALIACVAIHVTAAVVMSVWERTNLVVAMITGSKTPSASAPGSNDDVKQTAAK